DGIRDKLVTGVQTCALPISADHLAIRSPAGLLVFPKLPEAAAVIEPLGDSQFEEARGPGDRLRRHLRADPGFERLPDVLLIEVGDRRVVLGLLLDVARDEFER